MTRLTSVYIDNIYLNPLIKDFLVLLVVSSGSLGQLISLKAPNNLPLTIHYASRNIRYSCLLIKETSRNEITEYQQRKYKRINEQQKYLYNQLSCQFGQVKVLI
jgi:hypothetical protein